MINKCPECGREIEHSEDDPYIMWCEYCGWGDEPEEAKSEAITEK